MDVVTQLLRDRPIFHLEGTRRWDALPGTLRGIQERVRPGDRTMETGCGASTVVFAAMGAHHTSISPEPSEHERVRAYCTQIGVDPGQVEFIAGPSDLVLPEVCTDSVLDGAFIDGAHEFPYPAVDWHYISRAMKVGAWLVLDDIPIPSIAWVFRYLRSDPKWQLEQILDERAAAWRLTSERAGPEPYTAQPFNRWPDYSFAALPARSRLVATAEFRRLRVDLGRRFPALRNAWKRVAGSRGSS